MSLQSDQTYEYISSVRVSFFSPPENMEQQTTAGGESSGEDVFTGLNGRARIARISEVYSLRSQGWISGVQKMTNPGSLLPITDYFFACRSRGVSLGQRRRGCSSPTSQDLEGSFFSCTPPVTCGLDCILPLGSCWMASSMSSRCCPVFHMQVFLSGCYQYHVWLFEVTVYMYRQGSSRESY